jgi:hypothetical protein
MKQQFAWMAALALGATAMTGCSSGMPRPEQELARAEASIAQAEQAGARTHAGVAFDAARDKLGEARRLADADKNAQAQRLAQQAEADAEFAAATARQMEAQQAAREVRAGVETLRDETRRGAGATP